MGINCLFREMVFLPLRIKKLLPFVHQSAQIFHCPLCTFQKKIPIFFWEGALSGQLYLQEKNQPHQAAGISKDIFLTFRIKSGLLQKIMMGPSGRAHKMEWYTILLCQLMKKANRI